MADFAPTSLFKQQEEVFYKIVYAPAFLPRVVCVDGAHIAGQTER